MHRKSLKVLGAIFMLATGLTAHSAFAQIYTALSIGHSTRPNVINDSGWIGGETSSWVGGYETSYASYTNPPLGVIGHINYAGTPTLTDFYTGESTFSSSSIRALNQGALGAGTIAFRNSMGDSIERAALFTYADHWTVIGPDQGESWANAINDKGWVVGETSDNNSYKGFLWTPDSPLPAATPLPYVMDGTLAYLPFPDETPGAATLGAGALTINRDGLIGGYCGNSPYLWWDGIGYDISSWLPAFVYVGGRRVFRAAAGLQCQVN